MIKWEHFHSNDLKEKYLYRFLSNGNLEKFLQTGNIWMARADTFGDKMECVNLKDLTKDKPPIAEIEERKKKHLISCWHLATNESLAMWDTYVSDINKRRVLAIRFDTKTLISKVESQLHFNSLPNEAFKLIAGTVQYKNLLRNSKELSDADRVRYVAFRKEYVFKYENEFRFVIQGQNRFATLGIDFHLGKPQDLSFSILVNPLLEKEEYVKTRAKILDGQFANKFTESTLTKWLKPELW